VSSDSDPKTASCGIDLNFCSRCGSPTSGDESMQEPKAPGPKVVCFDPVRNFYRSDRYVIGTRQGERDMSDQFQVDHSWPLGDIEFHSGALLKLSNRVSQRCTELRLINHALFDLLCFRSLCSEGEPSRERCKFGFYQANVRHVVQSEQRIRTSLGTETVDDRREQGNEHAQSRGNSCPSLPVDLTTWADRPAPQYSARERTPFHPCSLFPLVRQS
jgi:hypothetical protein